MYLHRDRVGTYAAKGAIQPLDDHLDAAGIKTSIYRPAALREVTIDGRIYGIPEFYDTRNILMSGEVLKNAGLTAADLGTTDWNKLHTNAAKLYKAGGGKISRIGFDPKLPEFLPLWAKANGAELINADGSPNLADPRVIEALTYALNLIGEQGGWSKFKAFRDTWDLFGAGNEFKKEQAGAFPWEGWYVNVLVQATPKLELDSVPFTDRQGKPISFSSGSAWCLPKGAKNPAAALNWMKVVTATDTWLKAGAARQATVEENDSIFTGLWTSNPTADAQVRAKFVKPGQTGFDKAIQNYYASNEYASSIAPSKAGSEIKTAWTDAVNRALSGQQKSDAAMKQAQSEAAKAAGGDDRGAGPGNDPQQGGAGLGILPHPLLSTGYDAPRGGRRAVPTAPQRQPGAAHAMQMFDQAYTMFFGAQENSTYSNDAALFYVIYLFRQAFGFLHMGYASALAWLLFVMIMLIAAVQVRVSRRFVHYEGERD